MKFNKMPYKRIDFEQTKEELLRITNDFVHAETGEKQFEIHQKFYEFNDRIETAMVIALIRYDIDTSDDFYLKEKEYYDEIQPKYDQLVVDYKKELFHSKHRPYLEEKIGRVAFCSMEQDIKASDEKLIPLMQEENALRTKYNKLIASAQIEWEGEQLNLSLLKPYLTDPDREVRRRAYKKNSAFFESVKGQLDDIFDRLVKVRTSQARLMGYSNFVELGYYRMNKISYDKEMVENYRSQVKEFLVPFAQKLHDKRRERLGLNRLSYVDQGVFFTQGNPKPDGTPEEIMKTAGRMYHELSPETDEFFKFMMENELFDVLGRKTKRAGGYMTKLASYNAPFVFANFNGTSGDVDVMTHECGHAFHKYLSFEDPIREHREITMETAEIHSMSMGFFAEPWMQLFFGDRAEDYKDMHLEDAVFFIPYGCLVDEFQHIVYENPDMTPTQRNEVWRKLERIYLPHLDYEKDDYLERGGYWQRQQHIYNYPFYYIDYCIAQTCAMQYKINMDENYKKAWESYLMLCKLSSKEFFTDMLREAGLVSPFSNGCIEDLIEKLENKIVRA